MFVCFNFIYIFDTLNTKIKKQKKVKIAKSPSVDMPQIEHEPWAPEFHQSQSQCA